MTLRPDISLLGPLHVAIDGKPLPDLAARKARAVFARLAADAGTPIPRDALICLLWAERPETKARQSLSQALHLLRRWLGADAGLLVEDARGLRLDVPPEAVDALRAERLPRGANLEALRSALPRSAVPFLQDVTAEEEGWEDWVRERRERVHSRLVDLHAKLAEALAEAGRPAEAAEAAWSGQVYDSYDEGLHRARLRALNAAGRTGAALREYAAFADRFRADLQVEPSKETAALPPALWS